MTNSRLVRTSFTAALLVCLGLPLNARVGAPVSLSLDSADPLRPGEPITVHAYVLAGESLPHVTYEVQSAPGWQLLDGQTRWAGPVEKGQTLEFRFRAVPLSTEPGVLPAALTVLGRPSFGSSLDPERLGGRFPERARDASWDNPQTKGSRSASDATIEQPVEVNFEPGVALPEPLPATLPRLPGQQPAPAYQEVEKNRRSKERSANLVATGRFTFFDDNDVRRGVRNATVEILNHNAPFPDELCGRGITDGNGNFSIGGSCGDLFDGPDVFARIILNNSVVEVKPDSILSGSYSFDTSRRNNSSGGQISFGTITITSSRGAYQSHNVVMRAQQFMAGSPRNANLPKITVNWPSGSGSSFYRAVLNQIYLRSNSAFGDEGVLYHEYGHHILSTQAESPSPDYDNGQCDTPDPGHCLYQPEKGAIAWTEGWPNFFAMYMHNANNDTDGYGPTMMSFETRGTAFNFPGEEDQTEGIIAEILWDLVDSTNDDDRDTGAGRRDETDLNFNDVWSVIRNFDPSTSPFHNHPTSIHELYSGLRDEQLSQINRIASTYREAGIVKSQPDLEVSSVQNPPSQLARGASFSNSNTVLNDGNERANSSFQVQFRLIRTTNNAVVSLGTRTVAANLLAGSSNTANTTLVLPATMTAGTYRLEVCADSGGAVPESSETNNCRSAVGQIIVQ